MGGLRHVFVAGDLHQPRGGGDHADPVRPARMPRDILTGKQHAALVNKLRLAMMVNGVDFNSRPGGVVSATHGEAELDDTVAAMRNSLRMLKEEGEI